MNVKIQAVMAGCTLCLGFSTPYAEENSAGFTRRVAIGSQSALLTQTVENGSASYTIAYEKVILDGGDIAVKHCTRDRDCVIAPVLGGEAVSFGSVEGLKLIRQIAEKKSAIPTDPVVAAERQLQANLKSADEKIEGIPVADFDMAAREALVSPEPALASFAPLPAAPAPVPAPPQDAPPPPTVIHSNQLPWTLSFGAGFGASAQKYAAADEVNDPANGGWAQKLPAQFASWLRIPLVPVKNHGWGGFGVNLGYGVTRLGHRDTDNFVYPPVSGAGNDHKIETTEVRNGTTLHQFLWGDYKTPTWGRVNFQVGGGFFVGHDDNSLTRTVTDTLQTCTDPKATSSSCATTSTQVTTTVTTLGDPGWGPRVGPTAQGVLNVVLADYVSAYVGWQQFWTNRTFKVINMGVTFTLPHR